MVKIFHFVFYFSNLWNITVYLYNHKRGNSIEKENEVWTLQFCCAPSLLFIKDLINICMPQPQGNKTFSVGIIEDYGTFHGIAQVRAGFNMSGLCSQLSCLPCKVLLEYWILYCHIPVHHFFPLKILFEKNSDVNNQGN